MAFLTVKDLVLAYDRKIIAENIGFTVNEGDYLCIVGENGSGKTTLMKTLLGLQQPYSGEIVFGDGIRKNEIGYLPQQTDIQKDFPASVREIVFSGLQAKAGMRPFYRKYEKEEALRNMERLDIAELSKRSYRELSGGQQQRVLLARALTAAGKLLLLDEPVSGLDPIVTEEMYQVISDLNRNGTTIMMISHDIGQALKYATHILHIGEKTYFGTRDEYLLSPLGQMFTAGVTEVQA